MYEIVGGKFREMVEAYGFKLTNIFQSFIDPKAPEILEEINKG